MFTLTKKTDYALVALAGLVEAGEGSGRSARELAESFGLPRALIMNILKQLCQGGLIESTRGARGGYRLARPAEAISVLDVLQQLEGPMHLTDCCLGNPPIADADCGRRSRCPVRAGLSQLNERLAEMLRSVSIADLTSGVPCECLAETGVEDDIDPSARRMPLSVGGRSD